MTSLAKSEARPNFSVTAEVAEAHPRLTETVVLAMGPEMSSQSSILSCSVVEGHLDDDPEQCH